MVEVYVIQKPSTSNKSYKIFAKKKIPTWILSELQKTEQGIQKKSVNLYIIYIFFYTCLRFDINSRKASQLKSYHSSKEFPFPWNL